MLPQDLLLSSSVVFEQLFNAVLITDATLEGPDGPKILYVNPAFEKMSGYKLEEIVGKTPRILQGAKTERAVLERLKDDLRHGRHYLGSTINYRKDGSEYVVEWNVSAIKDEEGVTRYYLSIQHDITKQLQLQVQQEIFKHAIEQSFDHVALIDTNGRYIYVNSSYSKRTGYEKSELIGNGPKMLKSGKHDESFYKNIWDTLNGHKPFEGTFINRRKDGSLYYDDQTITPIAVDGVIQNFLVIGKDVTDYLERENLLQELAFKDTLTGLLNRRGMESYVDTIREELAASGGEYSIIFADIDHFKNVNDTYGHNVGDQVLKSFAGILLRHIRSDDRVFRWGGEEFVLIVRAPIAKALKIAENIRSRVESNVYCNGMHLTCSLGVALLSASSLADSIEAADRALYEAKEGGRNRVRCADLRYGQP